MQTTDFSNFTKLPLEEFINPADRPKGLFKDPYKGEVFRTFSEIEAYCKFLKVSKKMDKALVTLHLDAVEALVGINGESNRDVTQARLNQLEDAANNNLYEPSMTEIHIGHFPISVRIKKKDVKVIRLMISDGGKRVTFIYNQMKKQGKDTASFWMVFNSKDSFRPKFDLHDVRKTYQQIQLETGLYKEVRFSSDDINQNFQSHTYGKYAHYCVGAFMDAICSSSINRDLHDFIDVLDITSKGKSISDKVMPGVWSRLLDHSIPLSQKPKELQAVVHSLAFRKKLFFSNKNLNKFLGSTGTKHLKKTLCQTLIYHKWLSLNKKANNLGGVEDLIHLFNEETESRIKKLPNENFLKKIYNFLLSEEEFHSVYKDCFVKMGYLANEVKNFTSFKITQKTLFDMINKYVMTDDPIEDILFEDAFFDYDESRTDENRSLVSKDTYLQMLVDKRVLLGKNVKELEVKLPQEDLFE